MQGDKAYWLTFDLVKELSALSDSVKPFISDIIRSAITGQKLKDEDRETLKYVCWHSTIPIDDEEIEKWD